MKSGKSQCIMEKRNAIKKYINYVENYIYLFNYLFISS